MPPKKCPANKVNRRSFTRTLSDGKKVHVKRTCVPDKGAPGKTPKAKRILPKLDRKISLTKYGYSLSKTPRSRRASLARASSNHNPRKVLGRLNLIRNYTAEPDNKEKLSEDVKWMSGFYAKHKSDDWRRKSIREKKASLKRRASLRRQKAASKSNKTKTTKTSKGRKGASKGRKGASKKKN